MCVTKLISLNLSHNLLFLKSLVVLEWTLPSYLFLQCSTSIFISFVRLYHYEQCFFVVKMLPLRMINKISITWLENNIMPFNSIRSAGMPYRHVPSQGMLWQIQVVMCSKCWRCFSTCTPDGAVLGILHYIFKLVVNYFKVVIHLAAEITCILPMYVPDCLALTSHPRCFWPLSNAKAVKFLNYPNFPSVYDSLKLSICHFSFLKSFHLWLFSQITNNALWECDLIHFNFFAVANTITKFCLNFQKLQSYYHPFKCEYYTVPKFLSA